MYDFAVLPIRIILDSDDSVTVHLRDTQTVRTVRSEAILDVNHAGRWIRGIELVGGVDFNLSRAVMPFKPRRPLLSKSEGVTYDEEANAAFIYISMKSPVAGSLDAVSKYSHSIMPEAEFAFDGPAKVRSRKRAKSAQSR